MSLEAERDEVLAQLREREDELDHQRIARELHDSIGSTLGLVGTYADLVDGTSTTCKSFVVSRASFATPRTRD